MVEHGINLEFATTFTTLNRFSDPKERTNVEQMNLYNCYADMVISAITGSNKNMLKKSLNNA